MLETANHLIANKKNTALKPVQMLAQVHYVFTPNNVSARTWIGEIAHRRRDYPGAFALLLADTLPVARPISTAPEVD